MRTYEPSTQEINLSTPERWASLIGGGALIVYGAKRRSLGGVALAALGGELVYRATTGHCHLYEALGVSTSARGKRGATVVPYGRGIRVEKSITVNVPRKELYQFWRNFGNLPRFMEHIESVTVINEKRSHWVATGPAGTRFEWDAEIINDFENELISWRSLEGASVDHAGSVQFRDAPGNRGTELTVLLEYSPPGGALASTVAKLFGKEPEQAIREDLRRLKQLMEAGEIATTKGQPSGQRSQIGEWVTAAEIA